MVRRRPSGGAVLVPRASRQSSAAKAQETRTARAKVRAAKALARRPASAMSMKTQDAPDNATELTDPEEFSVSAQQAKAYLAEADEFLAWHAQDPEVKSIDLKDPDRLDDVAVRYLALQWDLGEEIHVARAVVFGIILRRGLPKLRSTLPRCRRALAGYTKEHPDESRDPAPIEALALVVDDLMHQENTTVGGDLIAMMAAAAAANQFDCGGRPSETLELTKEKVVEPRGRRFPRFAVNYHPQSTGKTSKSGTTDDTVMSGLDGDPDNVFSKILAGLHAAARPGECLFAPLTLATYERVMAESTRRCGLAELRLTPHSWRHGMASHALHHKLLDEKKLQVRMRAKCADTVRRYGKTGTLLRQVKAMGRDRRRQGEALLKADDAKGNPFLALVSKLKLLRGRRKAVGL